MSDELQFDRAESKDARPLLSCAGCQKPLHEDYYLVGAGKFCPVCREGIQRHLESGSKGLRLLKASLLGLLGALGGGALWGLFYILTKIMWGFVAVGVGYLVGIAVRKGSEGRGGLGFQFVAVLLVYIGVGAGYTGIFLAQAPGGAVGVLDILFLIVTVPAQLGIREPFTLLWLGIAVWEAWRLNTGMRIKGPFRLGATTGG